MMKMVLLCRSETLANERKEREVLYYIYNVRKKMLARCVFNLSLYLLTVHLFNFRQAGLII
jgi:hypothetical protein